MNINIEKAKKYKEVRLQTLNNQVLINKNLKLY